jgi:hypothetical protein
LHLGSASLAGKISEQAFPNPAPCPAHKAVIDRRRRAIFGRAIAPAATTLQYMHDATDHTSIVFPRYTSYIGRQVRLNPRPLFVAQPK